MPAKPGFEIRWKQQGLISEFRSRSGSDGSIVHEFRSKHLSLKYSQNFDSASSSIKIFDPQHSVSILYLVLFQIKNFGSTTAIRDGVCLFQTSSQNSPSPSPSCSTIRKNDYNSLSFMENPSNMLKPYELLRLTKLLELLS